MPDPPLEINVCEKIHLNKFNTETHLQYYPLRTPIESLAGTRTQDRSSFRSLSLFCGKANVAGSTLGVARATAADVILDETELRRGTYGDGRISGPVELCK